MRVTRSLVILLLSANFSTAIRKSYRVCNYTMHITVRLVLFGDICMHTNSTRINLYLKSLILTDSYKRARLEGVMRNLDATGCHIRGPVVGNHKDAVVWFIAEQSKLPVVDQQDEDNRPFSVYPP